MNPPKGNFGRSLSDIPRLSLKSGSIGVQGKPMYTSEVKKMCATGFFSSSFEVFGKVWIREPTVPSCRGKYSRGARKMKKETLDSLSSSFLVRL